MERHVLDRYENPRPDDFLTEFVAGQVNRDGKLAVGFLASQAYNLLFAGNVTTTHMLGSAMNLLVEHPSELERVTADYSLIPSLLEEALRLETPVQFLWRRSTQDCEIAGTKIPAGADIALLLGSGNRDDRMFEDPDRFVIDRPRVMKDQIAFGRGIHHCLGAPMARMEGKVALEIFFDRVKHIRLGQTADDIHHIENPSFRAPESLRIEFEPAGRSGG
jgi:cytochrome P450